ncbi:hypothetical protein ACFLT0_01080 [Chloroflexota bacterium]
MHWKRPTTISQKGGATLENRLARIKELYDWGHKSKDEYLDDYNAIQRELMALAAPADKKKGLEKLAHFLRNVPVGWRKASQEQRNRLASALFGEIWIEDSRVVEVKPRDELKPFFQLSFEEHLKKSIWRPRGGPSSHVRLFDRYLPRIGAFISYYTTPIKPQDTAECLVGS